MNPQQQANPTPSPHGYAHLAEDEQYSHNDPAIQNQPDVQPNYPVIVQGIPVMSYPAAGVPVPTTTFEINSADSSPLRELDSCEYQTYKYWIVLSLFFNVMNILSKVPEFSSLASISMMTIFSVVLSCWQVFQLDKIYYGIRQKKLEKMERGIYLMRIYLVLKTIYDLLDSVEIWKRKRDWENSMQDTGFNCGDSNNCNPTNFIVYAFRLMLYVVVFQLIWFYIFINPATKIRDLFKTVASNGVN